MRIDSEYISNNNYSKFRMFLSVLALILGATIYLFFRPTSPLFFKWIDCIGLGNCLHIARNYSLNFTAYFPNWVLYSLPDGLWAFAYALLILQFWMGKKTRISYIWISTIPLLIFGFEISQTINSVHGTFCWTDMGFQFIGILFAYILLLTHKTSRDEEKTT